MENSQSSSVFIRYLLLLLVVLEGLGHPILVDSLVLGLEIRELAVRAFVFA